MPNIKKFEPYFKPVVEKLKNLHAKPYAVAAGFACGAAISFTPFVGFHLILAALTAFILRGSIIASALGTVVGNPWTFALIWPATLLTGRWMLGEPLEEKVDFSALFDKMGKAIIHFNLPMLFEDIWPVLKPMMLGCVPYYIAAWFISYALVKRAVNKYGTNR